MARKKAETKKTKTKTKKSTVKAKSTPSKAGKTRKKATVAPKRKPSSAGKTKAKPARKAKPTSARKVKAAPVKKKKTTSAKKVKSAKTTKLKVRKKTETARTKKKIADKPKGKPARTRKGISPDIFFKPGSVAVIGASESQNSPGRKIIEDLLESGFKGKIYPVASGKKTILELKAYSAVNKIKDTVDLAILVSKKEATKGIIDQCGRKKVKGLMIIAPRYAGGTEKDLTELAKLIEKYRLQILGPDHPGIASLASGFVVNLGNEALSVGEGKACLITRSGLLNNTMLGGGNASNYGISKFIDIGDGLNLNESHLLSHFSKDKSIDVILIAIDAFSDPDALIEIGREVSARKPVFAVKPSTLLGSQDGKSEPGRGNPIADSLVFEKAGIVQCSDIGEFLGIAESLAKMPLPPGNRIGIVTNSKGMGGMISDTCAAEGLEMAEFQPKVKSSLGRALRVRGGVSNPVDVPAAAGLKGYKDALMALVKDPTVDIILAAYASAGSEVDFGVAELIGKAWSDMKSKRKTPKPIYTVWMSPRNGGGERNPVASINEKGGLVFDSPEDACRVAGSLNRYLALREVAVGKPSRFEVNSTKAERIIARARSQKREYLDDGEGQELLNCYNIPTITTIITASLVAAKKHAAKIGYPLALKGTSQGLINRLDMKAVALDIGSEREMVTTYNRIETQLRKKWHKPFRMMLQPMAGTGLDLSLGAVRHPGYPPVIVFGLGGPFSDSPNVVDFRIGPLSGLEARELVESSIAFAPLQGGPDQGAVNTDKLVEIVSRFSMMIQNHPEIIAADLNPLRAFTGKKFSTIDQLFRLAPK